MRAPPLRRARAATPLCNRPAARRRLFAHRTKRRTATMARSRAIDRGLTLSGARIFYAELNPLRYRGTSEADRRCHGDTGIAVPHQRSIPMKLSPTVPLALALAAGIAGAAMAQNSA